MQSNKQGQGAIEYLLIIGAAVIIAVIVIALMMSLSGQGTAAAEEAGLGSEYTKALIMAKSCKKLILPDDNSGNGGHSYYTAVTDEKVSAINFLGEDFEEGHAISTGNGPLIPMGTLADNTYITDRVYWALENGYISVLVDGKNALDNGYRLVRADDPANIDGAGDVLAVVRWAYLGNTYTWITIDTDLTGWDGDGIYGNHEEATVELCYLERKE